MKQIKFTLLVLCVIMLAAPCRAETGFDAITVSGAIDKPGDWTIAKLKSDLAADVTTLTYTAHDGTKRTSTVVPLISVLKAAGAQTQLQPGTRGAGGTKHAELHSVVVVQGADGYFTVLTMAELMTEVGDRHVWLAIDSDGKPLPAAEGPAKLIVPEDQKPARWVHAVRSISVIKVEPPATQPSH